MTPRYQRPLQSAVLAAFTVAALIFALSVFFGDWWDALAIGWQRVVVGAAFVAVGLAFSIANPQWRRGWGVVGGLRVNSRAFRDSLEEKGKTQALTEVTAAQEALRNQGRTDALAEVAAAQEELVNRGRTEALAEVGEAQQSLIDRGRGQIMDQLAHERSAAQKPVFHVERAPWLSLDDEDAFFLYNGGAPATNISVEASKEFWKPGKQAGLADTFRDGPLRTGIGKQFEGLVTAQGYIDGIEFTVHYLDMNGDPQTQTVAVRPEKLPRVDRQGNPLD